jgi:rare lipoprotein A
MSTTTRRSRCAALLPLAVALLVLAGCATRAPAPSSQADGAEARPPPDLVQVPDALPVLEPIRSGGPNKPYQVLGETFTPLPADAALSEQGLASWYGRKFHGRRTASGEAYNMYAMTAAHRTLPIPSYARVTNPANGRMVIVRVNDRGPFVRGRVIDLSYTAALKLGVLGGVAPVRVDRITPEEIRSGAWRRDSPLIEGDEPPAAATVPAPLAVPSPELANATATAGRGFWIQLGAYRERQGAEQMQAQAGTALDGIAPKLTVFSDNLLYRVQAGPFASREDAARAAERVREKLLLVPLVVERR